MPVALTNKIFWNHNLNSSTAIVSLFIPFFNHEPLKMLVKVLNCQRRYVLLLPIGTTHLLHMAMTLQYLSVHIRFVLDVTF